MAFPIRKQIHQSQSYESCHTHEPCHAYESCHTCEPCQAHHSCHTYRANHTNRGCCSPSACESLTHITGTHTHTPHDGFPTHTSTAQRRTWLNTFDLIHSTRPRLQTIFTFVHECIYLHIHLYVYMHTLAECIQQDAPIPANTHTEL